MTKYCRRVVGFLYAGTSASPPLFARGVQFLHTLDSIEPLPAALAAGDDMALRPGRARFPQFASRRARRRIACPCAGRTGLAGGTAATRIPIGRRGMRRAHDGAGCEPARRRRGGRGGRGGDHVGVSGAVSVASRAPGADGRRARGATGSLRGLARARTAGDRCRKKFRPPLDTRFSGSDHRRMFSFTPPPPPPPQRAAHNAELNERRFGAGRSAASFLLSCAAVPGGVSIPATGCGPGVKNAPGAPSACRDTDSPGLVRGAGIEPQHIQSMAARTIRHMLANPVLERAAIPNREATNDAATVEALPAATAAERPELGLRRRHMRPYYHISTDGSASSSAGRARGAAAPRLRTTAREARPQQRHRGREG